MAPKLNADTNLEHALRKFYGLPPYDNWTNLNYHDGIFYKHLLETYGESAVNKVTKSLQ